VFRDQCQFDHQHGIQQTPGNSSLHLFANGQGAAATNRAIWQDLVIVTNKQYTLSLWVSADTECQRRHRRLNLGGVIAADRFRPSCTLPAHANTAAGSLPPIDPLWLNEVQPQNATGPLDNFGAHEPWIELYNGGPLPISLDGNYLSDNYGNLTAWAFPRRAHQSREFKTIWADNQPIRPPPPICTPASA